MEATIKPTDPTKLAAERFQNFWRIFSKNRMALVGVGMLVSIILIAVFASAIAPYDSSSSKSVQISDI